MRGVVWAPPFLPWAWGQGAKMRRLGSAKPGSWASFWAMLALVGLVYPLLPQIRNLPYYQSPLPAWVDTVFMLIFTDEEGEAPRSLVSYLKSQS